METPTKQEARPRYQRKARHAEKGGPSLSPAAKDCIFALVMTVMCLAIVWGVSAMYQRGYVDGYEDAKAAYHG